MTTRIVAEFVYLTAINSDLSPDKRKREVLGLIDELVSEVALTEYHRGRADGAIEACRGLGGMDGSLDELKAALERSEK
jgi:hypothetical protein